MDAVPDGGVQWRARVKAQLADLDINWLDPCFKPTTLAVESEESRRILNWAKERGDYEYVTKQMKLIRHIDLRMTDISDAILVNIDLDVVMTGTYEEIFCANRSKKPIIIRCEQGKNKIPNWLFGALPHQMFFSTWDEVGDYLRQVARANVVDTYSRWCFFDLEPGGTGE